MYTTSAIDPDPRHPSRQSQPFPAFTKPNLVGFFSLNHDRQYEASAAQLKYLTLPPADQDLRLDLNEGFETHHPKPASAKDERIDMLLTFIRQSNELWIRDEQGKLRLKYGFVCFRGLLRLIACTPYEWKTGWIVQAIRYRGTIYLCEKPTPERLEAQRNETEQQKRFCYYGFKFEQHILTPEPVDTVPPVDTSAPVVLAEEFCSLFDATLAGNRILYGAEMDGIVAGDSPLDRERLRVEELRRCEFVEVKVKRKETTQRQVDNFYRYKTRNWWCQSFLVNVQRLVVGLRDDAGIVREITELKLSDIQRDSRPHWSPAVCMNFCAEFLAEVKRAMGGVDDRERVVQFEYDPQRHRRVRWCVLERSPNPDAFLPDWYTKHVEEMQPKVR